MTTSIWPDWMEHILAKSADRGEGGKPETLAQHTWYVLERLTNFISLRPDLPERLSMPRLWHILYWSAFLHDFGKATSGFQSMLRDGPGWPHRHEVFSLAFVDWISEGLSDRERLWLVAAIVSHHRDAKAILDSYYYDPYDEFGLEPLKEPMAEFDIETVQHLHKWLSTCGNQWIEELDLQDSGINSVTFLSSEAAISIVMTRGVERTRQWLNEYHRFVRQLVDDGEQLEIVTALALRGYIISSDHSASAHAGPLPQVDIDADKILVSRGIKAENLFEHQSRSGEVIGSALLTAPTGSGKTEAALLWAANQNQQSNAIPRLFYTLPYQASMNAMKLRLSETFGDKEEVGLQHGRSLMVLYRFLLEREYDSKSASENARWTRNLVKLNYPPIRIFSPYQILKGMYRLKGYEAMLSDYHNSLFVFDEIHAYDVKRLALILKTIEYLRKNFNAKFFIMSATFPSIIKRWLAEALDEPAEIIAQQKLFTEFCRHRLKLLEGELLSSKGVERAVQDARNGKSVLVVCNVVARAQSFYQDLSWQLEGSGIEVELLHGRFNMRDRSRKEEIVRVATGSKSEDPKPIVLIATQVVEVSLDIDLDTIYTEPAPLEALVQRFGRINRRRKMNKLALVHVYKEPTDGQGIYDVELVQRTLRILERHDNQPIDEGQIGDWLDEIYEGDVETRWQELYSQEAENFEQACINTLRPFDADSALQDLFYRAFDGMEILPEYFYDEYRRLRRDSPIEAGALLVPISYGRYHALCNAGKVLPNDKYEPVIVAADYNSEMGLTFD